MNVSFDMFRSRQFADRLELAAIDGDPVDPLVDLTRQLGRLDAPAPDPQFRADTRAMLMKMMQREGAGAAAVAPERVAGPKTAVRHRFRQAAMIGGIAGTMTVAGMATASGGAIPGDPLYQVRLSTEQAQIAFTGDQVARGQLYLSFAASRAKEAATLTGNFPLLDALLDAMDNQTRQGARLLIADAVDHHNKASLDLVDGFAADQTVRLHKALNTSSGDARIQVQESLDLLNAIHSRVDALRADPNCCAQQDVPYMSHPGADAAGSGGQPKPSMSLTAVPTPATPATQATPAGNPAPAPTTSATTPPPPPPSTTTVVAQPPLTSDPMVSTITGLVSGTP